MLQERVPSPACGRRWPSRQRGSDEGAGREARGYGRGHAAPFRHRPHPTSLREATFSRRAGRRRARPAVAAPRREPCFKSAFLLPLAGEGGPRVSEGRMRALGVRRAAVGHTEPFRHRPHPTSLREATFSRRAGRRRARPAVAAPRGSHPSKERPTRTHSDCLVYDLRPPEAARASLASLTRQSGWVALFARISHTGCELRTHCSPRPWEQEKMRVSRAFQRPESGVLVGLDPRDHKICSNSQP